MGDLLIRARIRKGSLRGLAIMAVTLVIGTFTPACSDSAVTVDGGPEAVAYFSNPDVLRNVDPLVKVMLAWVGTNWDWQPLEDVRSRAADEVHSIIDSGDVASNLEVFALARLALPEERTPLVNARAEGLSDTSLALHAALYCDERALVPEDRELITGLIDDGGYGTTHALLAAFWAEDLDCDDPFWEQTRQVATTRISDELQQRLASSGELASMVDDLSIEQTAFLLHAGATDVATPAWLAGIRDRQLSDGSWYLNAWVDDYPAHESVDNWHPTLLALWALSAAAGPGRQQPMIRTS